MMRFSLGDWARGKASWNNGKCLSAEHRQKLSDAHKRTGSPWRIGQRHTEETIQKISMVRKKQGSPWHFGCRHTEEAKIKISAAHGGKPLSEEHKKKLSLVLHGRHLSSGKLGYRMPEVERKKISFALMGHLGPSLIGREMIAQGARTKI